MALVNKKINPIQEGVRYLSGSRTGTRVAADFVVVLGFAPTYVRVTNLTDRISALQIVNPDLDGGSNAKGLVTIATGVTTYAATGITVTDDAKGFAVDVSIAGLETPDDDVFWEAWA